MDKEGKAKGSSLWFLTGLLLISCLFIFRDYLFGDRVLVFTDIGSDTCDQYLMHYQTIIHHLREGSFSLWDFNIGLGTNLFTLNLFDPFLMLLYLFGTIFGPDRIYGALVWMQILRIIAAGWAVYGFLSCFAYSERSKILPACLYGLCGYMMVWGQHYQFGTPLVLLPLLLMAAEKALRRKRWLAVLAALCWAASIASLYFAYMQFILLGFYFLFRISWEEKLFCRHGMSILGRSYGAMLLGIGSGAFSLIPSGFMILTVSGRVARGESFAGQLIRALRPFPTAYYRTVSKRLFSSVFQGINEYSGYESFYEDGSLFLSGLFLVAAVQFLFLIFCGVRTAKRRMLLIFVGILLGVVLLLPIGGLIFNGFTYAFFRHTFVCMPLFAWMIAKVLDEVLERGKGNLPLLVLAELAVAVQYLRVYLGERNAHALHLGILALFMGIFLTAAVRAGTGMWGRIATGGLALSLAATMVLDGYQTCGPQRTALAKAPSPYFDEMYDEDVEDALAWLEENDPTFYRVEKDYTVGTATSCLNSLAQNYRGVSTYNSTLNTDTTEFFTRLWPNLAITDDVHYSFANGAADDFQASLAHVRYVLSKKPDYHVPGYVLAKQFGDIYVYRNDHTGDLGKFYTHTVPTADWEAQEDLNQEAFLGENVLCDTLPELSGDTGEFAAYKRTPILGDEDIRRQVLDKYTVGLAFSGLTPKSGKKYVLEFDMSLPETAYEITVTAGEHAVRKTVGEEPVHVSVSVPEDVSEAEIFHDDENFTAQLSVSNARLYEYDVTDLSGLSEGIRFVSEKRDSRLHGTASVPENGVLLLAIPWEKGWHARVDGEETALHQVNYGLSGLYLEAGDHEIQLYYRCPGFLPGLFISLIFLLASILTGKYVWFENKRVVMPKSHIEWGRLLKKLSPYTIQKGLRYLKHYGPKEFWVRLNERFEPEEIPYESWYPDYVPTEEDLAAQRRKKWKNGPKFSIVVPAYRTPELFLRQMLDSLLAQTYDNWELCLANGSPEDEAMRTALDEYRAKDARIRYQDLKENLGIAENTNAAFAMAEGDFAGLLDHDDLLAPNALFEIASMLERHPEADVVYTDEDKVTADLSEHFQPHLKPDFNPDLLRSNNYICHFFVVRRSIVGKVGGFRREFDGAQDYDFIFRCTEAAREVCHVPEILYHWRTHRSSTADNPASKMYAYEAGKRAIEEHLSRCGEKGIVSHTKDYGFYQVEYPVQRRELVSIIIPNKDERETLETCLRSIRERSTYDNYEILIVENNSRTAEIFDYYRELEREENIRILTWEREFNYSAINNFAVQHARGDYLLFLNNDVEVIAPDWMERMLGNCQRPHVGAAGAKLYYPDDTIQHAGVVIGIGGIAGHMFVGMPRSRTGYLHKASLQQDLSAVTAACMMMRRDAFEAAGGFSEELSVAFNDVDLCLKVCRAGYLIVYDPHVELYHYESKSRGAEDSEEKVRRFQREIEFMRSRWIDILKGGDPFYNKNLSLTKWNYSLRPLDEKKH